MVNFKRSYNCEDENRGWIIDQVEAFQNEILVGYIKISYIPKENYKKFYASPLDYMCRIGGWGYFRLNNQSVKQYATDRKFLKSITWHAWLDNKLNEQIDHMTEDELFFIFKALEKFVSERYRKSIREFKTRWCDRPVIDYVHVYPTLRRKGIGTQLYLEAGKMMREKGLQLRASTLQSNEAKAVWEKFSKQNQTVKRGKYLYLSI